MYLFPICLQKLILLWIKFEHYLMNMVCKSVAENECGCTLYSGVHVCTRGGQMYRGHTSGSGSALTSAHNSEPETERL